MANTRISDLTASASNLASTDLAPVVQTAGVGPVKMTGAQIAAGLLSATTPIGSGPILTRAAAATLQLGAADVSVGNAVAQTLRVQSTTAASQTAPDFTIQGSRGTTAGGKIVFQTAATNTLATAFFIDKNGNLEGGSGPTWSINYATNSRLGLHNAYALCWGVGSGGVSANMSVGLRSEDITCLGLFSPDYNYNMSFRIYNNSGSKVNFQRLVLSAGATANMAVVAADNGGTGVAMGLQFGAALTTGGGVTSIMNINTSGHLVWNTDNTYDIGAATATRPRNVYAATSIRATGSTAVIGYGTGAGGAVTQATSRTTGVTLNKGCGQITLVSAAGSTSWQSFTVTNNTVDATDTIIVNQDSGTDLYQIFVTNVAVNSFQITFATTGGTTTEQPVFSFAVIKAVAA